MAWVTAMADFNDDHGLGIGAKDRIQFPVPAAQIGAQQLQAVPAKPGDGMAFCLQAALLGGR